MQQKSNSSLDEAIEAVKGNIYSFFNCHNVGRVQSFDPETMTATVEYLQLDMYNGRPVYTSMIYNVPIIFIGNKNIRITYNPTGALCLLCFMDRNIDNFLETGQAYFPSTNRKHAISDCIAICTFNTNVDEAPEYSEDDLTLSNKNGNINIYTGESDKIKVYNDKQNLKTILTNLITAIENITVESKPIDSNTELENVKTAIGELLE